MSNNNENTQSVEAFSLRLPADLKSAVSEIARVEKRSLNTQIVLVLEGYVKDKQAQTVALSS